MSSLTNFIEINYLSIDSPSELDSLIRRKFARLKDVCKQILKCQIKIANIAQDEVSQLQHSYLVSVNVIMPEGFDIYILRFPQSDKNESADRAVSDVLAMTYRKLIETKLENRLN